MLFLRAVRAIAIFVILALFFTACEKKTDEREQSQKTRSGSAPQAAVLLKGPYLQGASGASAVVAWETDRDAPSEVELSCPGTSPRTITGHSFKAERDFDRELLAVYKPTGVQHRATLDGLSWEGCSYRLTALAEPVGPFAVRGEPDEADEFSVVVYGDSRSGHEEHARIARAVAREAPELVLHTGDFVHAGFKEDDWIRFFDIARTYSPSATLLMSFGNHERLGLTAFYTYFSELFPQDNPVPATAVYEYGPLWVMVLNSEESFAVDEAQWRWAQEQLIKTSTNARIRFRFVMFHYPMITWGYHKSEELVNEEQREAWHKLFRAQNVTAVLAGHNHSYERFERDGVTYLTLGGGGANLGDPHQRINSKEAPWRVTGSKSWHYMTLSPSPYRKSLRARVIEMGTGKMLDEFELSANVNEK